MNLLQIGERITHRLPWRTKNQQILIDLIDVCPGACPTCPVGVQPRRDGHRMSLDTFKQILDKAQKECNVWKVQLYRFSDPLMHPDIHLFIEECVARGIHCSTSSFLQKTTCDWEKVARSGVTEFRVSFSGWKNMHIYQKPARITQFVDKFIMLSSLPWSDRTSKVMFFHIYKDNGDEQKMARVWAESHGFKFVPFPATMMVYDHIIEGYTDEDLKTISMLTETPEENIARHKRKPRRNDWCGMQEGEITLDAYGNMRLCQLMFKTKYIVGNYLDTPLADLRKKVMRDPMCPKCKAKGVGHYSLIFADPVVEEDPVATADRGKYQ